MGAAANRHLRHDAGRVPVIPCWTSTALGTPCFCTLLCRFCPCWCRAGLAFFTCSSSAIILCLRQQLALHKKVPLLRWVIKFAVFNGAGASLPAALFALLGPAILDELLADGAGMLAAPAGRRNLFLLALRRAVGALTRYYRLILKKKLKFYQKQIHADWFAGAASSTPLHGRMQASASITARQASFQRNKQKINDGGEKVFEIRSCTLPDYPLGCAGRRCK